jgi:hypothetical protein
MFQVFPLSCTKDNANDLHLKIYSGSAADFDLTDFC